MHCGLYALNHILGGSLLTQDQIRQASSLVLHAFPNDAPVLHIRSNGWYSEQVLAKALELYTPHRWHLTPLYVNSDLLLLPHEIILGAVVNQHGNHWVALKRADENNDVWLLDSLLPTGPKLIQ